MSRKRLGKENIKMLTKEKMLSPVIKFFQVIFYRKSMNISLENLYLDLGA